MPQPIRDWSSVHTMAVYMAKSPRSVDQLMRLMDQSQRTIYRWIEALQQEKYDVVRRVDPNTGRITFSVISIPQRIPQKKPA